MRALYDSIRLAPGLLLTGVIALASYGVAAVETRALGHPVVDALVVAIVLGAVVRTLRASREREAAGIAFAARQLLEVAVLLLGAAVDLPLLVRAGPALGAGIMLLVVIGLAASFVLARALGLPRQLAVLVACGNSICGNSAIAAVAPVIGADQEHVAASIAFTAVLGVAVVLGLPLLAAPLHLSDYQYGVLAGLTVYAVPQVLAAAFPVSVLAGQVGTLVKLVRVLMLGPVVLFFALRERGPRASFDLSRIAPWFIIGFLALAMLRALGALSPSLIAPARSASGILTVLAMAALGLGVDVRVVRRVGWRVVAAVTGSLAMLLALALSLIRVLSIA